MRLRGSTLLLGLLLGLALGLGACAPVLAPTLERQGEAITITVVANAPAYGVTLSVLQAATEDVRCGPIEQDFGCVLGDIPEGGNTVVRGTASGPVTCAAFGFSTASQDINSYRPYPCKVIGGTS